MTTFNTGNPIGSTDARDRLDNSENLDLAVNSLSQKFVDRFGVTRSTYEGVVQGLSFFNIGTFAVGFTLTNSRQTLTYDGHEYGWSGVFPKVVAAGSTPTPLGSGGWVDRSDLALRSELAGNNGAGIVGNAAIYIDDVMSANVNGIPNNAIVIARTRAGDPDGGGIFEYWSGSSLTPDNGMIFTPASGGGRLIRKGYSVFGFNGRTNIKWFGPAGKGTASDDVAAFSAARSSPNNNLIYFPQGAYDLRLMTSATGKLKIEGDGPGLTQITGFSYVNLSMPIQEGNSTVLFSDAYFEASNITFTGTSTVYGLTIRNQSQGSIVRSFDLFKCVFRGLLGLSIDNCQSSVLTRCDFIHNQYGIKAGSCTNIQTVGCNWLAPGCGIWLTTSADDTANRHGGESFKVSGGFWIDGQIAIKSNTANYVTLDGCMIDYFNLGLYLNASKFARCVNTYFGFDMGNKSGRPQAVPLPAYGSLYALGNDAESRTSGVHCTQCEFVAYSGVSLPPVRLEGDATTLRGIEEAGFDDCRFLSVDPANTMTTLLRVANANEFTLDNNTFVSSGNSNVTAPYTLAGLTAQRAYIGDNNFENVTNAASATILPADGYQSRVHTEIATVVLTGTGATFTGTGSYSLLKKYQTPPVVTPVVVGNSFGKSFRNLKATFMAGDKLTVYVEASTTDGTNIASGQTVTVKLQITGY